MKKRAGEKPADTAAASQDEVLFTQQQQDKLAIPLRIFGWVLTIFGVLSFVTMLMATAVLLVMVAFGIDYSEVMNTQLSAILSVVSIVVSFCVAFMQIRLGRALRKSVRRKAGQWAYRLIFFEIASLVLSYMLAGPSVGTVQTLIELGVTIALSVTIDPTLVAERHDKTKTAREQDRAAAEKGMLGRDLSGKGYLRLDFFNLFWMFFICCILGLVLEIIWHMTVVDPGVYEDRAGLLVGPFSPIYGFGAVLVTLALNRLYKNPAVTFVVSALVGGGFEWATAVFMKMSFGVTAWDYSSYTILGVPDPVAVFTGGVHEYDVPCHLGHPRPGLGQVLPAHHAQDRQHDSVEAALHADLGGCHPDVCQRPAHPGQPRLLVRARLRRPAQHAHRAVLRHVLQRRLHEEPLPVHDHGHHRLHAYGHRPEGRRSRGQRRHLLTVWNRGQSPVPVARLLG